MTLIMITSDIIQIAIGSVTAIGIIIAILSNRNQLRIFNQQLKLNFFTDYTKRYQEIILHFPENINEPQFDFAKLDIDARNKTLRYMRAYFDLCSEEYHLNKHSHIDKEVWDIWESGIKYAFSKKAFRDAWNIIMNDTIYGTDFGQWVNSEINSASA